MAKNEVISVENNITKKDFNGVFWRSFTLLGSFNYERMEALGFLYAIAPVLKKIYKDDEQALKESMHRHMAAFNMTVAPSPFVMGIAIAMEELAKKDKNFDVLDLIIYLLVDNYFWLQMKVNKNETKRNSLILLPKPKI